MKYKYQAVHSSRVSYKDLSFRISTGNESIDLTDSIARTGLINPPILLCRGENYVIVCGFLRIAACNRLGFNEIPALLLDENTSFERCAEIAVIDNTSRRKLNLVEQARALALLASIHDKKDSLLKSAKMVGLPVDIKMAEKLRLVSQMPSTLQSGLIEGTIALPTALQLFQIQDIQITEHLGLLLRELGLSLNRQRELISWITAIARREAVSVLEILGANPILRVRQDVHMDRRRKAQLIRDYLKRRRYPAISMVEQQFNKKIKNLNLMRGVHLSPPPNFESTTYSLRFDFQSHTDLVKMHEEFKRLVRSQIIKSLWDPFDIGPTF